MYQHASAREYNLRTKEKKAVTFQSEASMLRPHRVDSAFVLPISNTISFGTLESVFTNSFRDISHSLSQSYQKLSARVGSGDETKPKAAGATRTSDSSN